jgi:8-oxo-dGTP pyrophosphatase MutT (NUDIX family)
MQYEKSCGAIVYRKYHGNLEVLLIKHINSGHWSFPKGHVEKGETEIETAMREIKEETSIDVLIDPTFRETVSYSPRRDIHKEVVYFIARARNTDFIPQKGEVAQAKWVDINIVGNILTYDNDKNIINRARATIKKDAR